MYISFKYNNFLTITFRKMSVLCKIFPVKYRRPLPTKAVTHSPVAHNNSFVPTYYLNHNIHFFNIRKNSLDL